MYGIKRKGRENSAQLYKVLQTYISPIVRQFSEKIKLQRKIRIANIWAKRHPKRLMVYYISFAICLLSITLIADFSIKRDSSEDLGLKDIPSMSHRLQSLNNTEIQNERIKQEVGELGAKGMLLYNQLDSMMKLPYKTRQDSLKILSTYDILNNTFNKQKGHELKKD